MSIALNGRRGCRGLSVFFFSMLALFVAPTESFTAQELRLAKKGKTDYHITIPANSIPSERYAAEELSHYLHDITDATFTIGSEGTWTNSPQILIGESSATKQLGLTMDYSLLGNDGFVIRTIKNRLVIVGGKPRGTLNGVYTFLEEQLGVRWFTPELETIPKTNSLILRPINLTNVPALFYREVFWTEMMRNTDFASRHRLDGEHYALKAKHGGPAVVYYPFVHSFDSLIPPVLYAQHPEYFPLVNGKRISGYVQRCLSNPDVLELAKAKVREWIKAHPEASMISVSQNDTGNWCQCEKCKALDDAEGSPSASLIRFVNAIAEDVGRKYPNIHIDTLAYQYTRKPPKHLRPRKNVVIRLCSIECCFAHPLDTCDSAENKRFREDIVAWQPVAPALFIWDYTPNFGHYQQPFPNFDVLQPNVQFFVQHGVQGLFEQGNYSPGGLGEMGPLRAYLLAKLLWDPKTDLERHKAEFMDAYFGKAAPVIRDYLELLESQVRDGSIHAHIFDKPKAAYLNSSFLEQADKLLAHGEDVADSDTIRSHVQVARLPVWYVQIATNQVTGEDRSRLLENFLRIARKAGISHVSESRSLDDWAKSVAK
jgi:hypothetical protein